MSESGTVGKRRADTPRRDGLQAGSRRVRSLVASVIWLLAVVAALVLAVGALMVALRFNPDNAVVDVVTRLAERIDFGVLKDFEVKKGASASARQDAAIKSALVNWGIAAVVYLVVGKVIDRVVRPRK